MAILAQAILPPGLLADRPTDNTTVTAGRLYYATDNQKLYRDNGSGWDVIGGVNVYAWFYPDEAARLSADGFVSTDLHKLALQESDDTIWMLTSTAPTWKEFGAWNNPMLAAGDIMIGGNGGVPLRLAMAPPGKVLTSGVIAPEWDDPAPVGGLGLLEPNHLVITDGDGAVVTDPHIIYTASGSVRVLALLTGNVDVPQFSAEDNSSGILVQGSSVADVRIVYYDSQNYCPLFYGQVSNGEASYPSPILAGRSMLNVAAAGFDGGTTPMGIRAVSSFRMMVTSTEDFSPTAHGAKVDFWLCPNQTTVKQIRFTIDHNSVNIPNGTYNVGGFPHTHPPEELGGLPLSLVPGSFLVASGNGAWIESAIADVLTALGISGKEDSANKGEANGYAPLDADGLVPVANLPVSSLGFTPEDSANKGAADGYAPLDADGLVPAAYLPDLSLGYTPESVANKGVPDGYAPLDADGLVPIANLPAEELVISVNDYSGVVNLTQDDIPVGVTYTPYAITEQTKLAAIEEAANNYAHPTEDGDGHVPANGTTNEGKVLTAGATPGANSWTSIIAAALTGFTSGAGVVAATDTILEAIQKIVGNIATMSAPVKATAAEVTTGTDDAKFVTAAALQGSVRNLRYINLRVLGPTTDWPGDATGSVGGKFELPFSGTIVEIGGYNDTPGTTGTAIVDVNIEGSTIMTTDKLKWDSTEDSTRDYSGTAPGLTTTAVTAGQMLTVDVDINHTSRAKGLTVRLGIRET